MFTLHSTLQFEVLFYSLCDCYENNNTGVCHGDDLVAEKNDRCRVGRRIQGQQLPETVKDAYIIIILSSPTLGPSIAITLLYKMVSKML